MLTLVKQTRNSGWDINDTIRKYIGFHESRTVGSLLSLFHHNLSDAADAASAAASADASLSWRIGMDVEKQWSRREGIVEINSTTTQRSVDISDSIDLWLTPE